MTAKVFIDGEAGTTGLQIRQRLASRRDVTLLGIDEAARKDASARAEVLNAADLAILCLPDDAAREAVALIDNGQTRVIDASTAHRTAPGWTYGFPELAPAQAMEIAKSSRVSNPGCYPIGALSLIRPLIARGILPADFPVTVNAVSGYTGGGKSMIAQYEDENAPDYTERPVFVYGVGLEHKHVPEIHVHSGLAHRPVFVPMVGRYRQGMIVQVPLQLWALPGEPKPAEIHAALTEAYAKSRFVSVASLSETAALKGLEAEFLNGSNELRLYVFANEERRQVLLAAVLDNLGKGAAGSAVQNMNLMLGLDEAAGLDERLSAA